MRTPARVVRSLPLEDPSAFFASVADDQGLHVLPDGVSVTFELRGEGGGTWTVSRRDGRAEVARRPEPYPDCLLRCDVADFQALLSGLLDPRQGFRERRLDIEGDIGLVLRLLRSVG